jgi:hypothetical protein
MRTKTLALSAMLGALGTASVVAQTNVYSINAVGYINITLAPGFNMVACQLTTTNNSIRYLFPNASGVFNNCVVSKWNNATSSYSTDVGSNSSSYSSGWVGGGTIAVNPGEAIWFKNVATSNLTTTFVGTVPQGTNIVGIATGFNMIASPVPFSGDVVTNMGLTNYNNGDKVFVWNNPAVGFPHGTYTTAVTDFSSGTQGYMSQWDTPDPSANVGQGFWYNAVAPGLSWTQIFSINP